MIAKNLFGRTAYNFRGSPWLMWTSVAVYTLLALDFLLLPHPTWLRWLGAPCSALLAVWYCGVLNYYYRHREELAANPALPTPYSFKLVFWTMGITLAVIIAVFVVLALTVWRN